MTIDIDPVIFRLGGLEIRWYGVIMALAVAVGTWFAYRQAPRRGVAGDHVLGAMLFGIPGGIIGARLVHVLDNFSYYWQHPGQILGPQLIGLAIYGVLAGGLGGIILYCVWKKVSVLRVLDCAALAIPVGQLIGKCANIINGDTWGSPTGMPWGFIYVNPNALLPVDLLGIPTHPTPVYEQLWLLVVIGLVWYFGRRIKVDGVAILLYLALYSVGRFFISFFRVNNPVAFGLKQAQVMALAVLILAVAGMVVLLRRGVRERRGVKESTETQ